MRLRASILVALIGLQLSACTTAGYYWQAARGQWDLLQRREPAGELIDDPATPAALKEKLRTALAIRRFASAELALPDNGSYTTYADLERPFVVWNVFTAPALSLELREWCFPIAGCVRYRGYFDQAQAERFAAGLRSQGYDVFVGGVDAYSTLGWFDDPLLNTIIGRSDARLAGLIFHELAHQTVYVEGDTTFNESFATTVEQAGVERWLARRGDVAMAAEYRRFEARKARFIDLVLATRDRLEQVYRGDARAAEQRAAKADILADLREHYRSLRDEWEGYGGFDAWFAGELNNARIAAVGAYHDYVPQFTRLLAAHDGDFAAFYQAVERIAELPAEQRLAALRGNAPGVATHSMESASR